MRSIGNLSMLAFSLVFLVSFSVMNCGLFDSDSQSFEESLQMPQGKNGDDDPDNGGQEGDEEDDNENGDGSDGDAENGSGDGNDHEDGDGSGDHDNGSGDGDGNDHEDGDGSGDHDNGSGDGDGNGHEDGDGSGDHDNGSGDGDGNGHDNGNGSGDDGANGGQDGDSTTGLGPLFLILDDNAISKGDGYWKGDETRFNKGQMKKFNGKDINEKDADLAVRIPLYFFDKHVADQIWLRSGYVGDEGWFAPAVIPSSWVTAGPTSNGLRNFVGRPSLPYPHDVGPGLGTGSDPEALMDEIPDVIPLRATGLNGLNGRDVCAVVYDSGVSINYGPLVGNLQGANLGVIAFRVHEVVYQRGFSSSALPRLRIEILDAISVCESTLSLYTGAPRPLSSSEPFDITP